MSLVVREQTSQKIRRKSPRQGPKKRYISIQNKGHLNPTEREILIACKSLLMILEKTRGIFWRRIPGQGKLISNGNTQFVVKSDASGFSDLLIIDNGKIYAVELKRPYAASITDEQIAFLTGITLAGGLGAVVTSAAGLQMMLDGLPPAQYIKTDTIAIPMYY